MICELTCEPQHNDHELLVGVVDTLVRSVGGLLLAELFFLFIFYNALSNKLFYNTK